MAAMILDTQDVRFNGRRSKRSNWGIFVESDDSDVNIISLFPSACRLCHTSHHNHNIPSIAPSRQAARANLCDSRRPGRGLHRFPAPLLEHSLVSLPFKPTGEAVERGERSRRWIRGRSVSIPSKSLPIFGILTTTKHREQVHHWILLPITSSLGSFYI